MLRVSPKDLLRTIEKLMEPHRRLLFWWGPFPVIALKKYDDIIAVSTQSQDRGNLLNLADEWLGTGVLNANYDEWRKSRKILAPAFSSLMLSRYVDVFKKKASILVDSLEPAADSGEIFDCQDTLIQINIDAIVENTIGVSMNSVGEEGKQFGYAVAQAFRSFMKRMRAPWLYPSFVYKMYLKLIGEENVLEQCRHFPAKILKELLRNYKNSESLENDESSKTIISLLVKGSLQEPTFTEARMRDELLHIIIAASETTAINVGFSLLMLAIHQDVQQKVYEEISELFIDNDDALTADHLFHQLKYLEQCIKETSRKYTNVVLNVRRTHKECILGDNTIIPANIIVVPLIHLANQDAELYKNPQKWDPEHFSDEAVKNRPKSSFMSFGYGPRSCLGDRYAIMSIKTQIVHIVRKYHLSTNIKELTRDHLTTSLSIESKIGYPIKFTRRIP